MNESTGCVIFDCDGTLVDSEYLCNQALQYRLSDVGINVFAADLVRRFRGVKLAFILETVQTEHNITLPDDFIAQYRATVETLFDSDLRACEGVVATLETLMARNMPMCVASSGPPDKIAKALAVTGLTRFFGERVFSSYVVGTWKPEPGLFLHAADQMNVTPARCMVVEDSSVGIEAARAAAMHPVLYDPSQAVKADGCEVIVHMGDLLALLP